MEYIGEHDRCWMASPSIRSGSSSPRLTKAASRRQDGSHGKQWKIQPFPDEQELVNRAPEALEWPRPSRIDIYRVGEPSRHPRCPARFSRPKSGLACPPLPGIDRRLRWPTALASPRIG